MKVHFLLILAYNIFISLDSFIVTRKTIFKPFLFSNRRYNIIRPDFMEKIRRLNSRNNTNNFESHNNRKYHITKPEFVEKIHRLNSKNNVIQNNAILGEDLNIEELNEDMEISNIRINIHSNSLLQALGISFDEDDDEDGPEYDGVEYDGSEYKPIKKVGRFEEDESTNRRTYIERENSKSKNFVVVKKHNTNFADVGGYESVKLELEQCVDILKNYERYIKYNVRIPKGLILEGPPGTGKTLFAKALAGEAKCNYIAVSGSDFQEKYVGVGPTRIKELFELAKKNIPCIIFIDEIDAVGRKRSSDGESSSSERDNTLNALLVELDGFKNNTGIFMIAATNRIDLLDDALIRPGRIDKKIFIGLPDTNTRKSIIDIHIKGKPYGKSIVINDLVEITEGYSGAEIENLLNEAMLNALRFNNTEFCYTDFDLVLNKMMAGWQPVEHEFTSDIIDHIAIHEMGHAIVGFLSKYHSKMSKVVINLSSPKSPGYTVFKSSASTIYTRDALFEHLMILLSGRIAEEVFYNVSVTTGAINDFEEALKLAEKMILYYGMGSNIIYPRSSDKYKEMIDNDVIDLINNAYSYAEVIIIECKSLIYETSELLKKDKILKADKIQKIIDKKYKHILNLSIDCE